MTDHEIPTNPQVAKLNLEVEYLKQQNEILSFELADLKSEYIAVRLLKRYLPVVTGLIAVAGFWFGLIQYIRAEKAARKQQDQADQKQLEQQRVANDIFVRDLRRETAKPLWDRQLGLYIEATEAAATIATTRDDVARKVAEARFWVLYWGPLAAVEDVGLSKQKNAVIEAAMVKFGDQLQKGYTSWNASEMEQLSLELAHSVRNAIAPAFDVQATDLADLRTKTVHDR
jgi:hypothetical protein